MRSSEREMDAAASMEVVALLAWRWWRRPMGAAPGVDGGSLVVFLLGPPFKDVVDLGDGGLA